MYYCSWCLRHKKDVIKVVEFLEWCVQLQCEFGYVCGQKKRKQVVKSTLGCHDLFVNLYLIMWVGIFFFKWK